MSSRYLSRPTNQRLALCPGTPNHPLYHFCVAVSLYINVNCQDICLLLNVYFYLRTFSSLLLTLSIPLSEQDRHRDGRQLQPGNHDRHRRGALQVRRDLQDLQLPAQECQVMGGIHFSCLLGI